MRAFLLAVLVISGHMVVSGQSDCNKYFHKGGDEFEGQFFYYSDDVLISKEGGKEVSAHILFGKNVLGTDNQSINESGDLLNKKECYLIFKPSFVSSSENISNIQISILFKDSSIEKRQINYSEDEKCYILTLFSNYDSTLNENNQLITYLTEKQIKGIRYYLEAGNEDFFLTDEVSEKMQYLFRCAEKLNSTLK